MWDRILFCVENKERRETIPVDSEKKTTYCIWSSKEYAQVYNQKQILREKFKVNFEKTEALP